MLYFFFIANHDDSSDYEGYEEKEASRTHSVKFSEDSAIDKEVSNHSSLLLLCLLYFSTHFHFFQTPFVRQNTPHPKELKLKAHKLFAKEKSKQDESNNLDNISEEVANIFTKFPLSKAAHAQSFILFFIILSHHPNHRPEKLSSIPRQWITYLRHKPTLSVCLMRDIYRIRSKFHSIACRRSRFS